MQIKQVVLATGNPGKVEEMQRELQSFGFSVIPQTDFDIGEAVEDGLSFVENAIKKARYACQHTGLPAIADDSGLEVDALDGAPGIYSARYADGKGDVANYEKLLDTLANVATTPEARTARYQCVIAYLRHAEDPTPILCQGAWEGHIALSPKGSNGFGYDPVFYVPEHECAAAELEASQKKLLSHRAKALALFKAKLNSAAIN